MDTKETICGANCEKCFYKESCPGCAATCGRPFGEECIAAEYIRIGGREKYAEFKKTLLREINELLASGGIPAADALYEQPGSFVNLAYPLPNGGNVKLLDDKKIYLSSQIEAESGDFRFGVLAGMDFIVVCRFEGNGENPELLLYKKR